MERLRKWLWVAWLWVLVFFGMAMVLGTAWWTAKKIEWPLTVAVLASICVADGRVVGAIRRISVTSIPKRSLALLALSMGLIAAAPYGFHAVVHRNWVFYDARLPFNLGIAGQSPRGDYYDGRVRSLQADFGQYRTGFLSYERESVFYFAPITKRLGFGEYVLPRESITLRVACAVALGCVWLLVLSGRMLTRRLTQKNVTSGRV